MTQKELVLRFFYITKRCILTYLPVIFLSIVVSSSVVSVQAMEHEERQQDPTHSRSMKRLGVVGNHLQNASSPPRKLAGTSATNSPETLLVNWYKQFKERELVKEAVVVVGNAGVGKSTLIASLQGAPLIKNEPGQIVLRPAPNPQTYPTISLNPFSAQTSYPEFFKAKNGLVFVDTPGLKDSEGVEYDTIHDVILECTTKSVRFPRLLIVVDQDDINPESKGERFRELVSYFSSAFSPDVFKSVLWVVTRCAGRETEFLKNLEDFRRHLLGKIRRTTALKKTAPDLSKQMKIPPQHLQKESENFEDIMRVVGSIDGRNLVFFDPLKTLDSENLLARLETISVRSSNVFRPNPQRHTLFKVFAEKVIRAELKNYEDRERLQKRSHSLEVSLSASDKFSNVDETPLKIKIQQEIAKNTAQYDALSKEKNLVAMDLAKLKTSETAICLYDRHIDEKRSWVSPAWTVQSFEYKGSPITHSKKTHDPFGHFRHWELDGNSGSFKAEYVGGLGRDAWAEIKLFGSSNAQPDIQKCLISLSEREHALTLAISAIQAKIGLLEDLQKTAGPTREQYEEQKGKLRAEKTAVDKDLASILRDISGNADLYKAIH